MQMLVIGAGPGRVNIPQEMGNYKYGRRRQNFDFEWWCLIRHHRKYGRVRYRSPLLNYNDFPLTPFDDLIPVELPIS